MTGSKDKFALEKVVKAIEVEVECIELACRFKVEIIANAGCDSKVKDVQAQFV
jgi:hypothetical protein